jgi:transcriptional regulator with XRE-family HTH domain
MTLCNTDSEPGIEGFKTRLKIIRDIRGLTQAELAEKAGFQPSHISHFETGERLPSADNLRSLCIALNVSADYLLDTDNDVTAQLSESQAALAEEQALHRQALRVQDEMEKELKLTIEDWRKVVSDERAKLAVMEEINLKVQDQVGEISRLWHADIDQLLSTQLANRRLREALGNLRDWAVANTTKPIHDLLAFTDSALSAPSDEQLIDRVVTVLTEVLGCELYHRESCDVDGFTTEAVSRLLTDLKGAANE